MSGAILVFGLVTIPCKEHVSASSKAIGFTQLTSKGNRVKNKAVDAVTGEEVERSNVSKAFEISKGVCVPFTEAELKSLDAQGSNTVEIKEFVNENTIRPFEIEKTYYLSPEPGAERGYALLAQTMLRREVVAVAQWTVRGRENLVVVVPYQEGDTLGLLLKLMFYKHEVRDFKACGVSQSKAVVSDAEATMADKLLDMLYTEQFDSSKYTDSYAERVKAMATSKKDGNVIPAAPESGPKVKGVIDLAALLQQSLETKKPKKTKKTG